MKPRKNDVRIMDGSSDEMESMITLIEEHCPAVTLFIVPGIGARSDQLWARGSSAAKAAAVYFSEGYLVGSERD